MSAISPRYAFEYDGNVTAQNAILKALGNDGPLTVEKNSLVAGLIPDALEYTATHA